jgi:rfaE bifunctional protein kinase chain/domain
MSLNCARNVITAMTIDGASGARFSSRPGTGTGTGTKNRHSNSKEWVCIRYTSTMTDSARLLEIIDRFDQVSVVLLGDLVLDRFVLGTPKRISREAPVIILRREEQRDVPGGGANALANLRALDVRAVPVGVVGDDEPGAALLEALEDRGVDSSGVLRVAGYSTPTKVRILGGGPSSLKHQVARYDVEDRLPEQADWRPRLATHLERAAAAAGAVAISDYGYGAVSDDAIRLLTALDGPPPWICADSRYRVAELVGVDAATPNLEELEAVAGEGLDDDDAVAAAAEALRQRLGAGLVLATRGNRGMTLVTADQEAFHLPVFGADEVADVTGAGDTVLAVLAAALAAGARPPDAARLANYAGGLVVMKLGTATVSRAELRAAVRRDLGGATG